MGNRRNICHFAAGGGLARRSPRAASDVAIFRMRSDGRLADLLLPQVIWSDTFSPGWSTRRGSEAAEKGRDGAAGGGLEGGVGERGTEAGDPVAQ